MNGIIGQKIGMTTYFQNKKAVSSTVILAVPNQILQVKTKDKDGYSALKLGIDEIKEKKQNKKYRKIQELPIREEEEKQYKSGDTLDLRQFKIGDKVKVSGLSKGKGFAGVIKKYGFSRGPETHGSEHHRAPGSIGSMFPQRVFRGKKMPGRMGQNQITIKNLEIINIDSKNNLICLKGAIPGRNGSFIFIKD